MSHFAWDSREGGVPRAAPLGQGPWGPRPLPPPPRPPRPPAGAAGAPAPPAALGGPAGLGGDCCENASTALSITTHPTVNRFIRFSAFPTAVTSLISGQHRSHNPSSGHPETSGPRS